MSTVFKTCVVLRDTTSYCHLGVEINGELNIVELNFINSNLNWGASIITPDGKIYTKVTSHKSNKPVTFKFNIDDLVYCLSIDKWDNDSFMVYLEQY